MTAYLIFCHAEVLLLSIFSFFIFIFNIILYIKKFAFLLFLFFLNCQLLCSAALPKFLGGSGLGINAQKANLENNHYPTYWENLMREQSSLNLKQGFYDLAKHDYKSAEQTFAKATIKGPQKPYPHIFLGIALYWQGKLEEAREKKIDHCKYCTYTEICRTRI